MRSIAISAGALALALAAAGCDGDGGGSMTAAATPTRTAAATTAASATPTATAGASASATASATAAPSGSAGVVAQAQLDAYENVARHIYTAERAGEPVRQSLKRIAKDTALLDALAAGRPGLERTELMRQLFLPHYHVVRLRVTRAGRVTGDVGSAFPVAGSTRSLGGGSLLAISIQDVIGYVKIVHEDTGLPVIVRGQAGHVVSSLPALTSMTLPASGPVTVAGTRYLVRSFSEPGFAGETLQVSLLLPSAA